MANFVRVFKVVARFIRVLVGLALLVMCAGLLAYMVGFPLASLINLRDLLFLAIVLLAMLIITKGFRVFGRSVRFLVSSKANISENDFKAAVSMLKSFSNAVIITSVMAALFHIFQPDASRPEILWHGVGGAIGDMSTGLLVLLLIINPVRATIASKFYTQN